MCTEDGSNHDGMSRQKQRGWLAINHTFGTVCALLRICKQLLPCPNSKFRVIIDAGSLSRRQGRWTKETKGKTIWMTVLRGLYFLRGVGACTHMHTHRHVRTYACMQTQPKASFSCLTWCIDCSYLQNASKGGVGVEVSVLYQMIHNASTAHIEDRCNQTG